MIPILRDYHEELKSALLVLDPGFHYEDLAMWKEHVPTAQPMDTNQLAQADSKIDQLVQSQNKLSFDADCLALARDAAQLAVMYREEQKTDRAARLARVLHLKQQNQIGSNLTTDFMQKSCQHVAGPQTDLHAALDKAWVMNPQKNLLETTGLQSQTGKLLGEEKQYGKYWGKCYHHYPPIRS